MIGPTANQDRYATKAVTFDASSGKGLHGTNTTWFTVSGQVLIRAISGYVTTTVTGASSTATLGVTGSTALFIAATTGTTLTSTNNHWVSTTATANGIALPSACTNIVIDQNILSAMHATNDITAGVVEIHVIWAPLSAGATLS